ncbi:MAG: sugar phosphate isomerase/epimerase [Chitinophagaceae bacterium]
MKYTRNEFLKLTGLGISGAAAVAVTSSFTDNTGNAPKDLQLKLGLASYTLRALSLDETIRITKKLGLTSISLKSMHMPLESSPADIKKMAEKVRSAGIDLYAAGVIYMKTKQEVDTTFAYAVNAGLNMIVGVPNHDLLQYVEEQVKKTDIKLAIHNHGPGDTLYQSPDDVYAKIKDLDHRIGFCIDIAHVQRIGQDPSAMLLRYKDRLLDMHMKDVIKDEKDAGPIEIGRGMIDIPKVVKTLKKIKYQGYVAFEYEKDEKDPIPGLAESVGYTRGIMKLT